MLNEIKRQLRLSGAIYATLLPVLILVPLVFGTFIYAIINSTGDTLESVAIGMHSMQSVIAIGFLVISGVSGSTTYNMALKMGAVRKYYIGTALLLNIGICVVLMLLTGLWKYADIAIASGFGIDLGEPITVPVHILAAVSAAVNIFGLWMGALLFRYGRRGFWISYGVFMTLMLAGPRAAGLIDDSGIIARSTNAIVQALNSMANGHLIIVGLAVAAVLGIAAHACVMMYRGDVTA